MHRRGWHYTDDGIYYYHHPQHYGLIAVHYNDGWYWTRYYEGYWYSYHPGSGRWLSYVDGQWWYYDNAYGWMVYYNSNDRFYRVDRDRIVRDPYYRGDSSYDRGRDPYYDSRDPYYDGNPYEDEADNGEEVFYSEDGTRMLYLLGKNKQAHLYSYPEMEHIEYLAEHVKAARFTNDKFNQNAMIIFLELEDGQIAMFDRDGRIYGQNGRSGNTERTSAIGSPADIRKGDTEDADESGIALPATGKSPMDIQSQMGVVIEGLNGAAPDLAHPYEAFELIGGPAQDLQNTEAALPSTSGGAPLK